MKCARARRLLELMVGGDLVPHRASRVRKHLETCRGCQDQAWMYSFSLDMARQWLKSEKVDWPESEWEKSIRRAFRSVRNKQTSLAPWPFKKSWALAAIASMTVFLVLFVIHPTFVKQLKRDTTAGLVETVDKDILELRIISQETGLKINWFFHKDLKLEVLE